LEDIVSRMRRINRLLQQTAGCAVDFEEIAESLACEVDADTYVLDRKGNVLGYYFHLGLGCNTIVNSVLPAARFPDEFTQWLSAIGHTLVNYRDTDAHCVFDKEKQCGISDEVLMVVPVKAGGKRMGTLAFLRSEKAFDQGDILIGECGATAVGMEMLHLETEKAAGERRKRENIRMALDVLSFSELKAIQHIFEEVGGDRGCLVASKVADTIGITRSVIVNALRKLESAGVIESRSLGMKGTYVRSLNPEFLDALDEAL
jgi:transcriptional pleiotropic repressor